jgi:hypothetical protein
VAGFGIDVKDADKEPGRLSARFFFFEAGIAGMGGGKKSHYLSGACGNYQQFQPIIAPRRFPASPFLL